MNKMDAPIFGINKIIAISETMDTIMPECLYDEEGIDRVVYLNLALLDLARELKGQIEENMMKEN